MNNDRQINTNCPECKSTHIYHDSRHDETFCNNCGLIIQDNTLTLITSVIAEETIKEQRLRKLLWHRHITLKGEKQL